MDGELIERQREIREAKVLRHARKNINEKHLRRRNRKIKGGRGGIFKGGKNSNEGSDDSSFDDGDFEFENVDDNDSYNLGDDSSFGSLSMTHWRIFT